MSDSFVRILEGDDGSVVSDSHNCSCLSTDHGDSGHDGGHGGHHAELVLLFPFVVLAVGAGSEMLVHKTPIPYTTFLLLIGGVIGGLMREDLLGDLGKSGESMAAIDAHLLLYLFLPPLIYESAYNVNEVHFTKIAIAAVNYAFFGLLIATVVTAGVINTLYSDWTWFEAGLLGALLSATDPVAVVALLKQVGTGSLLDTLIEAESLLNDGTAMVVFTVLFEAVKAGEMETGMGAIILKFVQMAIGGPIFGVFMGYIFSTWIGKIFNESEVEVSITLCAAYLTFFIGEYFLGLSGVLAVVACGIYMGNRGDTQVSPEVEEFLKEFWELLGYIANTCIFTLTGVIIIYNDMWSSIETTDIIYSVIIYATIMLARFVIFSGINFGLELAGLYVPTKQETYICCWGALRGAVGLALGLLVWDNKQLNGGLIDDVFADKVLFHAAMIVIATLTVNATTVAKLLKFLGLDKVDDLKDKLFRVSMEEIGTAGMREVESLKMDELISCASWPDVRKHGNLKPKPKRTKDAADEDIARIKRKSKIAREEENSVANERSLRKHLTEVREMRESRRRCLAAVKASYRNQFRHGLLSRLALHFLENLTEKMIDNDCQMNDWEYIAEHHLFSRVVRRNNKFIRRFFKRRDFELLQFGYDVVCGFYHARTEALHSMEMILGGDSAAYHHLRSIINDDQEIAKKTILEVQRYLPEIAANIATLRATRSMLNVQRFTASQLYEEGFLDKLEHSRVIHMIEERMHHLKVNPPEIAMPSKYDLIKEISWLSGAPEEMVMEISELATEHMVDEGEVIIKQGEHSTNMFLVARGTCTVVFEDPKTGKEEVLSDIGVGTLIGDISWLNSQPRTATVLAASRGLIYSFNGENMKGILNRELPSSLPTGRRPLTSFKSSGRDEGKKGDILKKELEERRKRKRKINTTIKKKLWKSAGLKLGENLLRYQEPYNVWDKAELRRWLMQWILYVPDGDHVEIVRPCILLDGTAQQPWQEQTGEKYESPKYLKPVDGKPMKLKLDGPGKVFCPPGAIKESKQVDIAKRRSSIDEALFQAAGWKLIKQKMINEKKGGWGKLAIDLKGAVAKEKEAKEQAKIMAATIERRGSTNFLSEGIHGMLLQHEQGNDSEQSPMTSPIAAKSPTPPKFQKAGTEKVFKSAAIKPTGGGPERSTKRVDGQRSKGGLGDSSGLTKTSNLEMPDNHLPKRGRVMKELSFKQKSNSNGKSLDSQVTEDTSTHNNKVATIGKALFATRANSGGSGPLQKVDEN